MQYQNIFVLDFQIHICKIWHNWVCLICYQFLFAYKYNFQFQEFPFVRCRAAKGVDGTTATTGRDLIPSKLAAAVWNSITSYKSSIPNFPSTETCELLIVDRSVDQVS